MLVLALAMALAIEMPCPNKFRSSLVRASKAPPLLPGVCLPATKSIGPCCFDLYPNNPRVQSEVGRGLNQLSGISQHPVAFPTVCHALRGASGQPLPRMAAVLAQHVSPPPPTAADVGPDGDPLRPTGCVVCWLDMPPTVRQVPGQGVPQPTG